MKKRFWRGLYVGRSSRYVVDKKVRSSHTGVRSISLFVLSAFMVMQTMTFMAHYTVSQPVLASEGTESSQSLMSSITAPQLKDKIFYSWQENPGELQELIAEWTVERGGTTGVMLSDISSGTVLAQQGSDIQFFPASVYKLLVAYVTLLEVQDGRLTLDDIVSKGWTREKCLTELFRISESSCPERMMQEIEYSRLNDRLVQLGLQDTSFFSFLTSARDTQVISERLYKGTDLTPEHRRLVLDGMASQIYRYSIVIGAGDRAVYSKIGIGETGPLVYNDVSLIELHNGEVLALSVFTQNGTGRQAIAQLTRDIMSVVDPQY